MTVLRNTDISLRESEADSIPAQVVHSEVLAQEDIT